MRFIARSHEMTITNLEVFVRQSSPRHSNKHTDASFRARTASAQAASAQAASEHGTSSHTTAPHAASAHGAPARTNAAPSHAASPHVTSSHATAPRKKSFLTRAIEQWCNRLMGAVTSGTLSGQEAEYAAGRTSRDYICNTIGTAAWGMVFPLLTIVVTQLVGVELAGMFSLAFVTASLLMIVANYGVRTFQVSDIAETHSFSDYQLNRWITCALAILVGVIYCSIRGYNAEMFTISMGVYVYKVIDGLADVYEGRLQQADKFYLAGISQAFRSLLVLIVFSLFLLISHNLPGACIAMAVAAVLSFLVLTFPLALLETPKSARATMHGVSDLFKQCATLFIALFMYSLIDNMPKFVMEGVLSYDNQLYFNALYFPAQMILLAVGLVYKPLLVRMAEAWADPEKHRRFDLSIAAIMLVILAITGVVALIMAWIGIPIMSFMYGLDFEPFRGLCFIMLAAGGVTAAIDFLYQVITVLRRQKDVMRLYAITFGFSLFVPILLINFTGLPGAIIGYLIVMCILLVLLVSEYISIRLSFGKGGKGGAHAASAGVGAGAGANAGAGAGVGASIGTDASVGASMNTNVGANIGASSSVGATASANERLAGYWTINENTTNDSAVAHTSSDNVVSSRASSRAVGETMESKRKMPSEIRAERTRRAEIREKWENRAREKREKTSQGKHQKR